MFMEAVPELPATTVIWARTELPPGASSGDIQNTAPSLTVTSPILATSSTTMIKGSVYDVDWAYTGAPFDVRVFLYEGNYVQRKTVTGALCAFPFYYQGKTHTRCARDSGTAGFLNGDEWCPTNVTGLQRDAGHRERCTPLLWRSDSCSVESSCFFLLVLYSSNYCEPA